ncbi:MAG: hypothetical protein WCG20_03625 [bacterium]
MPFTKNPSHKNLALIHASSNTFVLNLNPLIKKHGIRFTLQLIKSLVKVSKEDRKSKSVRLIEPRSLNMIQKKIITAEDSEQKTALQVVRDEQYTEYLKLLTECGFTFNTWFEDFVDEDTGEVVSIERREINHFANKLTS